MKHTLKYFFSFCLLFSLFLVQAQENDTIKKTTVDQQMIPESPTMTQNLPEEKKTETLIPVKTNRFGLRVGIDLFKLTRALYDKNYKGLEITGDYRLTKKHFLAAEVGNENKTTDDSRMNFTTKGSYIKVGFDYNGYENWLVSFEG